MEKIMVEVVALWPAAGCVKGSPPLPPVASVPHDKTPFVDFTSQAAAPRPETVRFVVDAMPVFEILKSVVEALLETKKEKVVAAASEPQTVSCEYGVEVPMPSCPEVVKVEVAVPPKYAWYAERSDDDALPLNNISDVVALCPATGCVKGSYDAR